jgi:hypothetical protein
MVAVEVGGGVLLQCCTDHRESLPRVRGAGEVEGERLDTGEDRMGVGVDETRGDEPTGGVDDAAGARCLHRSPGRVPPR